MNRNSNSKYIKFNITIIHVILHILVNKLYYIFLFYVIIYGLFTFINYKLHADILLGNELNDKYFPCYIIVLRFPLNNSNVNNNSINNSI